MTSWDSGIQIKIIFFYSLLRKKKKKRNAGKLYFKYSFGHPSPEDVSSLQRGYISAGK